MLKDSLPLLAIAAALAAPVLFLLLRPKKKKLSFDLPIALPELNLFIVGHAHMLGTLNNMQKLFVSGASVDGVSRFKVVGMDTISVTKAEHVKAILTASNYRQTLGIISKHDQMFLGAKSLVRLMKDEWKVVRRAMASAFNWEYLRAMVKEITEIARIFTESLSKHSGETIDIWPLMKCATIDIIGKSGLGFDFNCSSSLTLSKEAFAFKYLLEEYSRRCTVAALDPFSYFYSLPCEANTKHADSTRIIRSTISSIIDDRLKIRAKGAAEHDDMLKHVLDACSEEKTSLNPKDLSDTLMTILFAGYDSSSIALAYTLYMMAKHKDVETKARLEVLSALGDNQVLSYEEITTKLPYCTAVINEVLRLYPPVPTTARAIEEPVQLVLEGRKPVTIPSGTFVFIPIWFIHRSELNYEDPEAFDPDRFFDPVRAEKIHRYAHVVFSGGARDCVGRRFAMIELLVLFSTLLRKFSFECPIESTVTPELTGVVQKPIEGGIHLKLVPCSQL